MIVRANEGEGLAAPFDLSDLKTCSLFDRPSKVSADDLGRPMEPAPAFVEFLDQLPRQLAAHSLRRLCDHLVRVCIDDRVAVCALGGHVIKTGCASYLIDWMRRGVIRGFALNGAAAIHDLELALAGKTSEDVGPRLLDGSFGMARETAQLYAQAARLGRVVGLGRALGQLLDEANCAYPQASLLLQAYRQDVPVTVHVAIGTDVVHMHPQIDGGDLGESSLRDFKTLTTLLTRMQHGLWLNLGCAVVMPEVFLKAVSIAHNFGHSLDGLVTANLDMIQQYRGRVNVCQRPTEEGIQITGHHEILIPLIHAAVVSKLEVESWKHR